MQLRGRFTFPLFLSIHKSAKYMMSMSSFSFVNTLKNTLFVATKTDIASLNIATHLARSYEWKPIKSHRNEIKSIQTLLGNTVYLWLINEPLLHLNDIPNLFSNDILSLHEECAQLTDIIFLSRHAASSGTLSLTVHPIGIPWMIDSSTVGGIPGKCSPPNPRISSLYRSLLREVKLHDVGSNYQVTLEATHHGPYVGLPACFVEIGSTEREWGDEEAGLIWSQCLAKEFNFPPPNIPSTSTFAGTTTSAAPASTMAIDQEEIGSEEVNNAGKNNVVVISIGGGHYVPKMNDLARLGDGIYIGHCLTTYALEDSLKEEESAVIVPGGWRHIIHEAIASTMISFPGGNFICLVDKKAFISKHCKMITEYLDTELNIPWTH